MAVSVNPTLGQTHEHCAVTYRNQRCSLRQRAQRVISARAAARHCRQVADGGAQRFPDLACCHRRGQARNFTQRRRKDPMFQILSNDSQMRT